MIRAPEAVARLLAGPGDLPPPDKGAPTIRQAAREITSRAEFRRPGKSLTQTILDWLGNLLDRILRVSGGTTLVGYLILLAALALIGWLVYRATRSVHRDPGRRVSVMVDVGRPATDWHAEAAAHEAAGEWREALRCRYRALIAELAARGTVREVPGRTTGEYRAEITRAVPHAAADFGLATDLFEGVWYGARKAGPEENHRFDDAARAVLAPARAGAAVGAGARS